MCALSLDGAHTQFTFGVLETSDSKATGELKCFKYVGYERKAPKINPCLHANFQSLQEGAYVFHAILTAEILISHMQQHSWKLFGWNNGKKDLFQPWSWTNAYAVLT